MQARIMEAAQELFFKKGFDNVSMRAIASKIGYSPGAIYRYFENKKEILSVLRHEAFGEYIERLEAMPPEDDPLERVRRACRFYYEFAMNEPDRFRLMFTMVPSSVALGGKWSVRPRQVLEMFMRDVAACSAQGRFPGHAPEDVAHSIWCTMHGFADLAVSGRLEAFGIDPARLADRLVDFTLR